MIIRILSQISNYLSGGWFQRLQANSNQVLEEILLRMEADKVEVLSVIAKLEDRSQAILKYLETIEYDVSFQKLSLMANGVICDKTGNSSFKVNAHPSFSEQLVDRIVKDELTFLSRQKLHRIIDACQEVDEKSVDGLIVEAGCALGGSCLALAATVEISRSIKVYDVFGLIPPPGSEDPENVHARFEVIKSGSAKGFGGNLYYGYEKELLKLVKENISSRIDPERFSRIKFVEGLIQDTMQFDEPIALAHVDLDWYEPVYIALARIFPNLSHNGMIIVDDYYSWIGCRQAVDDYLATQAGFHLSNRSRSLTITRIF